MKSTLKYNREFHLIFLFTAIVCCLITYKTIRRNSIFEIFVYPILSVISVYINCYFHNLIKLKTLSLFLSLFICWFVGFLSHEKKQKECTNTDTKWAILWPCACWMKATTAGNTTTISDGDVDDNDVTKEKISGKPLSSKKLSSCLYFHLYHLYRYIFYLYLIFLPIYEYLTHIGTKIAISVFFDPKLMLLSPNRIWSS